MVNVVLFVLVLLDFIIQSISLSGHVCQRERAENYETSYNQAFLCQERYTTSCGHLDWRRCTKYRIQTCYTPKQRYATRYRQVEECCPGWREDDNGDCNIPVCLLTCQNGGWCDHNGGDPRCSCPEGYYGNRCQSERNSVKGWEVSVICACAVIFIFCIAISVVFWRRLARRKVRRSIRLTEPHPGLPLPHRPGGIHQRPHAPERMDIWTCYRQMEHDQRLGKPGHLKDSGHYVRPIYPTAPSDCSEL